MQFCLKTFGSMSFCLVATTLIILNAILLVIILLKAIMQEGILPIVIV